MDCKTALAQLELLPLDAEAALDPSLDPESIAEAMSHVAECPQEGCGRAFASHQQWNQAIAETFHQVSIPVGLKDRIHQSLQTAAQAREHDESTPEEAQPDRNSPAEHTPAQPVSRRSWLVAGGAIAACCLLGFGWLALPHLFPQATITVTGLRQQMSEQLADYANLQNFPGEINSQLPESWQNRHNIEYPQPAKQYALKSSVEGVSIPVSLISFQVNRAIPGVLVVLPAHFVEDAPQANTLQNGKIKYQHDYIAASWTEGDYVYICYVHRQRSNMQQLQQALQLPAA